MFIRDIIKNYQKNDKEVDLNSINKREDIDILIADISNLLNSKPIYTDVGMILKDTIINYGMNDLSQYSIYSKNDQIKVGEILKDCLYNFEPRLKNITVVPVIKQDNYGAIFNYRITAIVKFAKQEEFSVVLESEVNNISKRISFGIQKDV